MEHLFVVPLTCDLTSDLPKSLVVAMDLRDVETSQLHLEIPMAPVLIALGVGGSVQTVLYIPVSGLNHGADR
eukprot:2788423-Amphidinium_carterae.2